MQLDQRLHIETFDVSRESGGNGIAQDNFCLSSPCCRRRRRLRRARGRPSAQWSAGGRNSVRSRNHHLFQPLLYQVATASLATSEIAWPVRHLLRDRSDVSTLLAKVEGIDKDRRHVLLDDGSSVAYDTLVLATGARHAYFGHDAWENVAPGLKTLEDATTIRRRILLAFEKAERESDHQRRQALQTFVVIGGGATGVEMAGAIAELAHDTLVRDFRSIDTRMTRVVLIEAGARILPAFIEGLAQYAHHSLEKLGVEVVLGEPVTDCSADGVIYGGERLAAATIVWAAGVQASPAARWIETEADRAGRVIVEADLTVPGFPEIFVIGDGCRGAPDGGMVPGIAPAAKQQGGYVAASIRRRVAGKSSAAPFRYRHQEVSRRSASASPSSISDGSDCAERSPGGYGASPTSTFLSGFAIA
jgi:NADH dehydrogenase